MPEIVPFSKKVTKLSAIFLSAGVNAICNLVAKAVKAKPKVSIESLYSATFSFSSSVVIPNALACNLSLLILSSLDSNICSILLSIPSLLKIDIFSVFSKPFNFCLNSSITISADFTLPVASFTLIPIFSNIAFALPTSFAVSPMA